MSRTQAALFALALPAATPFVHQLRGQVPPAPDSVIVQSGALALRGLLWRPSGMGPFPAILFNHGSFGNDAGDTLRSGEPAVLGPVFAKHGYVFMFLFRRGVGASVSLGPPEGTLMSQALAGQGQEGRNHVQLELLEGEAMNEATAGLGFLRSLPEVDTKRIGVAGHSFGASLTLLLAARDTMIRAAVTFSGSAASWTLAPELRERLLDAVAGAKAPMLLLQAANDYSTAPGRALAAELERLGKPHGLKIYPAVGSTSREGHNFLFTRVDLWEADVFAFLNQYLQR